MNLRSKTIGLLAGTALALGSVLGVTAQEADTEATLLENSGGICSASVTEHDFGDFEWNGTAYVGDFTGSFEITTTQTISPDNVDCDYTFTGTSLTPGENGEDGDTIDAGSIELTDGVNETSPMLSATSTFTESVATGEEGTEHFIDYDLENAMGQQTPEEYTGSITVTVVLDDQP